MIRPNTQTFISTKAGFTVFVNPTRTYEST